MPAMWSTENDAGSAEVQPGHSRPEPSRRLGRRGNPPHHPADSRREGDDHEDGRHFVEPGGPWIDRRPAGLTLHDGRSRVDDCDHDADSGDEGHGRPLDAPAARHGFPAARPRRRSFRHSTLTFRGFSIARGPASRIMASITRSRR